MEHKQSAMGSHTEKVMLDRLMAWNRGEAQGPRRVTLFPTNRCNLQCRICWQRGAKDLEYANEISHERLITLVDEAAQMGVQDWDIIGGGEPLLRSEVVAELCRRIRHHGMNGVLQTNGTLLNSDVTSLLVDIGWREIHVSLDGPTREINDNIRSKGSFDTATKNIRGLADLKRKHRSQLPRVSLYSVITSTNYDKMEQMVDVAHEMGCDGGIQLTTLVLHDDAGSDLQLQDHQKVALPEQMEKAIRYAALHAVPNNFQLYLNEHLVQNPNAMTRQYATHAKSENGRNLVDAVCFEPWLSAVITANGTLGPCCAFWDPAAGNIQRTSLQNAWMGAYMQDIRKRLVENKPPPYCSKCPSILFAQSEILRAQLQFSLIPLPKRVSFILRKAANALRTLPPRQLVRRGLEWVKIYVLR